LKRASENVAKQPTNESNEASTSTRQSGQPPQPQVKCSQGQESSRITFYFQANKHQQPASQYRNAQSSEHDIKQVLKETQKSRLAIQTADRTNHHWPLRTLVFPGNVFVFGIRIRTQLRICIRSFICNQTNHSQATSR
jgi:hypothetical protein